MGTVVEWLLALIGAAVIVLGLAQACSVVMTI